MSTAAQLNSMICDKLKLEDYSAWSVHSMPLMALSMSDGARKDSCNITPLYHESHAKPMLVKKAEYSSHQFLFKKPVARSVLSMYDVVVVMSQ